MKNSLLKFILGLMGIVVLSNSAEALNGSDVSIRYLGGYFWLDNACTPGGPQGKVVSFRIVNTKNTVLRNVQADLGSIGFTATGSVSYTSGTPSFSNQTSSTVYFGDIPAGDSVTAFYFIGYNCLIYPNNSAVTTDYVTLSLSVKDNLPGTVTSSVNRNIYVIRNSSNNTITMSISGPALLGTISTLTVDYTISNVKPTNIIDMEISSLNTFPSGYEIVGCKVVASTITADFPVNLENTHYNGNVVSNLPTGGSVTMEWYLKVTKTGTAINGSNTLPYVVADAGGAHRWQTLTSMPTPGNTPVNPLVITKRVNERHVLTGDTVVYTVVLHNSNSNYDITIDRLVDNLPRDYKYRYIEDDPNVFPRLVTNQNSTVVPDYNDTNTLLFRGTKELSTNVFSWLIPKADSVKLIYSVKVSSNPGLLDTNFVSAFIGPEIVGAAHEVVNVYTMLGAELQKFESVKQDKSIALSWDISGYEQGLHFELYRLNQYSNAFDRIADMAADPGIFSYVYRDYTFNALSSVVNYKLILHYPYGSRLEYFSSVYPGKSDKPFVFSQTENSIEINCASEAVRELSYEVFDINGRLLDSGTLLGDSGFSISKSQLTYNGQIVYLRVQSAGGLIGTEKVLIR